MSITKMFLRINYQSRSILNFEITIWTHCFRSLKISVNVFTIRIGKNFTRIKYPFFFTSFNNNFIQSALINTNSLI